MALSVTVDHYYGDRRCLVGVDRGSGKNDILCYQALLTVSKGVSPSN